MKRTLLITFGIVVLVTASMSFRIASEWTRPQLPRLEKPRLVVYEIDMPAADTSPVLDDVVVANVALQLDDPRSAVREDAVERLAEIGGAEAINGLGYALSDASDTVRRLAIEGLARLGSDDSIAVLVLVMDDPDVGLRELAVDELADIGTPVALVLLQGFVSDADVRVRMLAAEHLGYSVLATESGL
jgi:HEAT repeat protein